MDNRDEIKLEDIVKNISYFEFRSLKAMKLKHDLRGWYYGKRDPEEERGLTARFRKLFSGNMIIDVLGGLIWDVSSFSGFEGAALPLNENHIVGSTIRPYALGTENWKDPGVMEARIYACKEEAQETLETAAEALYEQIQNEKSLYRKIGLSASSIPLAVMGFVAILLGIAQFLPFAMILLNKGGLLGVAQSSPLFMILGEKPTLALIALCFVCTLLLLFLAPALFMVLKAGIVWIFYKSSFKEREALAWHILQGIKTEGLDGYCKKLCLASERLLELPYDILENDDPSYMLLGERGAEEIFSSFQVYPLKARRSLKGFCARLDKRHIKNRKAAAVASVIVLAAVCALSGALWT